MSKPYPPGTKVWFVRRAMHDTPTILRVNLTHGTALDWQPGVIVRGIWFSGSATNCLWYEVVTIDGHVHGVHRDDITTERPDTI